MTDTPAPQPHMDAFEALARKIEQETRLVSGGPHWCDGEEPMANRGHFARMVREFAKSVGQSPQPQKQPVAWLRHGEAVPVQGVPFGAMWISDESDPRAFPVYASPKTPHRTPLNKLYDLPCLINPEPESPLTQKVTDAMVEAACSAYWPAPWPGDRSQFVLEIRRSDMRRALDAALTISDQESL